MSPSHKKPATNKQVPEKIIGLTTDSVAGLLQNTQEQPDKRRVEIRFKRGPHGLSIEKFVTGLGPAVVGELALRGIRDWQFDLEGSREAGQESVSYGYGNPGHNVWKAPVLVFLRRQTMAEVIPIGSETERSGGQVAA